MRCVRLRGTRKPQSKDVDGRCDGDEISFRDQRVGTSYSDSVKEDVSLEYITMSLSVQETAPLTVYR